MTDGQSLAATLQEVGIDAKAAEIYVTLLGKNRMSLADIARATGIKRPTCYEHVDTLLQRDFVTRVPVGKRTLYSAVSPKNILADFKKRTAGFEERLQEMVSMHERAINKPHITFYEGKREIRRIYGDLFKTVGDTYSIFPADAFFESFNEEDFDDFDRQVGEHAFKERDLFVASKHIKKLREIRAKNGDDNQLDKVLPTDFKSNVDVLIFSDKVALISLRDLSAIVIENKDISELFRSMHSLIWKNV